MRFKLAMVSLLTCMGLHAEPTTMLIPVGAGGLVHRYAIQLQPVLSDAIKNPIVMEFKQGGQGLVAAKHLASINSDRMTLLIGPAHDWTGMPGNVSQLSDMIPVAYLGTVPAVIFSKQSYPNIKSAISKKYTTYGIPGSSANVDLMRQVNAKYGDEMIEVPYKSGTEVVASVISGSSDLGVSVPEAIVPFVDDRKLYPVAVFAAQRSKLLPQVPTLSEQGISIPHEFKYHNNVFLWVNKGISNKDVTRLQNYLNTYFQSNQATDMLMRMDVQFSHDVRQPEKFLKQILE
jgi:tripartite-type tricarboxylate transporter receptor subunit TctC